MYRYKCRGFKAHDITSSNHFLWVHYSLGLLGPWKKSKSLVFVKWDIRRDVSECFQIFQAQWCPWMNNQEVSQIKINWAENVDHRHCSFGPLLASSTYPGSPGASWIVRGHILIWQIHCFHKSPQLRTWFACGPNWWNGPQLGRI